MLLKSQGTYPRIYCKICEQTKEQGYFRGMQGIMNGICEECENDKNGKLLDKQYFEDIDNGVGNGRAGRSPASGATGGRYD